VVVSAKATVVIVPKAKAEANRICFMRFLPD
jgi:hypothetical protein